MSSIPAARSSSIASITLPYGVSSSALMSTICSVLSSRMLLDAAAQLAVGDRHAVDEELAVGVDADDRLLLRVRLVDAVGRGGQPHGARPSASSGATIIMMISRTSMTSTSGVTLMSDFMPPFAPPTSIDMT